MLANCRFVVCILIDQSKLMISLQQIDLCSAPQKHREVPEKPNPAFDHLASIFLHLPSFLNKRVSQKRGCFSGAEKKQGFDLSVLNDVDQSECSEATPTHLGFHSGLELGDMGLTWWNGLLGCFMGFIQYFGFPLLSNTQRISINQGQGKFVYDCGCNADI